MQWDIYGNENDNNEWEDDLPEPPPPGPTENGGFEGPMGRFFAPPSLALEPEGPQYEHTPTHFFHRPCS